MAARASPPLSPSAAPLFPTAGAQCGLTGSGGAPAGAVRLCGGRQKTRPPRSAGQWARGPAPAASADGAMSVDRSRPGRGAGVRGAGTGRAAPRGRRTPGPRRPPPTRSREGSGLTETAPARSLPRLGPRRAGSGPAGWGRGEGVGWLRGAEGEGAFCGAAQKGAARPGESRGCEGAAGAAARRAQHRGCRGTLCRPGRRVMMGFGFALFVFVRCEAKWSSRKEASRASSSRSPGGS